VAGGRVSPPHGQEEHARWQQRDLSARRYVDLWADGVPCTPRLEHQPQRLLGLLGADASGRKQLVAVEDGFRDSAQSWRELLLRLGDENGLKLDPELATGDGALGFWQARHEVWPKAKRPGCPPGPSGPAASRSDRRRWVHTAANVLNKLPPSLQGKAKQDLHAIDEAESRKAAEDAFTASSPSMGRSTTRL
jgi:transposase-like protein